MTLADRQAAALAALHRRAREPYRPYYPGETQPSGDMPLDPEAAAVWLAARYPPEPVDHRSPWCTHSSP